VENSLRIEAHSAPKFVNTMSQEIHCMLNETHFVAYTLGKPGVDKEAYYVLCLFLRVCFSVVFVP